VQWDLEKYLIKNNAKGYSWTWTPSSVFHPWEWYGWMISRWWRGIVSLGAADAESEMPSGRWPSWAIDKLIQTAALFQPKFASFLALFICLGFNSNLFLGHCFFEIKNTQWFSGRLEEPQLYALESPLTKVNPGSLFRVGVDFHFGGLVNFFNKNWLQKWGLRPHFTKGGFPLNHKTQK
jgi:hypothetical protein